jgi:hypothetical protein
VTEEEAKTKWCPHVRYMGSDLQECGANRWKQSLPVEEPDALNPVACRCIGSACMMWRWKENQVRQKRSSDPVAEWEHISAEDSDDGFEYWAEPETAWLARWQGHCGLAGKP